MATKKQVLAGRKAVDAYRTAHIALHKKPYYRKVHEDHTPLLNIMLGAFKGQGFNSIQEFFDANREHCLAEVGIYDHPFYKDREDLVMLGQPTQYNGVELEQRDYGRELIIDGQPVMYTTAEEHASMMLSVEECPDNARVFIGGLGLGLVLAYLVYSGKAREIIVCEIDDRVIHLLGQRITDYLKVPIQIVSGDASEEIQGLGKFDWIYIDLTRGVPPEFGILAQGALTNTGIYTPYNFQNWQVWH